MSAAGRGAFGLGLAEQAAAVGVLGLVEGGEGATSGMPCIVAQIGGGAACLACGSFPDLTISSSMIRYDITATFQSARY